VARNQSEEIRAIMLESARVQVATLNAGIAFWSSWVDAAGKFVQTTSRELATIGQSNAKVDQIIGRVTDSSREYLRRVIELPNAAVAQFNADLKAGRSGKGRKRTRAAKAKD
jgi:outer membrane murein-binding lipoprotein Lpp